MRATVTKNETSVVIDIDGAIIDGSTISLRISKQEALYLVYKLMLDKCEVIPCENYNEVILICTLHIRVTIH